MFDIVFVFLLLFLGDFKGADCVNSSETNDICPLSGSSVFMHSKAIASGIFPISPKTCVNVS